MKNVINFLFITTVFYLTDPSDYCTHINLKCDTKNINIACESIPELFQHNISHQYIKMTKRFTCSNEFLKLNFFY